VAVPTFVSALTLQSPLVLLLGLAALTIFHEDIAIAAGAGIVTAGSMAPVTVALALVAGIIGGDMLIYGLGRLADDIPLDSPPYR
jgi:membrane protein DedA with SNARE-associated domain